MKYKGIIFDLDGVICSTDRYHYLAWKKAADSKNIYFDEHINHRLRGVSRMESLEIILEQYTGTISFEEKLSLTEEKNRAYVEYLRNMSPRDLAGEVKDTLEALRAGGYLLAIGSSSKNAAFILERLGLTAFFDAVSDGTNIVNSKPDPEVFIKAAQFLHLQPAECLIVEDAAAGIEAAANGGFDSAGLGEAASHSKATYSLTSFQALWEIL